MDSNARIQQVSITRTVPRQTPNNDFGTVMARAVSEAARVGGVVMGGITGMPAVSAAVSSVAQGVTAIGGAVPGTTVGGGVTGGATGGAGSSDAFALLEAQRLMQENSQSFSTQYLALQNGMQKESREFNTVSNIMKVRHDSAKAAINNIR